MIALGIYFLCLNHRFVYLGRNSFVGQKPICRLVCLRRAGHHGEDPTYRLSNVLVCDLCIPGLGSTPELELELELKPPDLELELIFKRLAGVGVGVETPGVGVGVDIQETCRSGRSHL